MIFNYTRVFPNENFDFCTSTDDDWKIEITKKGACKDIARYIEERCEVKAKIRKEKCFDIVEVVIDTERFCERADERGAE